MRASRRTRNRIAQTTAFWLFRFATYAILAAATYIFLDIGIKGSRTLFTTTLHSSTSHSSRKARKPFSFSITKEKNTP